MKSELYQTEFAYKSFRKNVKPKNFFPTIDMNNNKGNFVTKKCHIVMLFYCKIFGVGSFRYHAYLERVS